MFTVNLTSDQMAVVLTALSDYTLKDEADRVLDALARQDKLIAQALGR